MKKRAYICPNPPQILHLFVPFPLFSRFSRKKFAERLVSSEKGRTFALAFQKGGHETRSLTDCEQNTRQAARTHIIYYIWVLRTSNKSFLYTKKDINEQWSRMSLAGSDRSIIKISITVKSLILAQDER